MRIDEHESRLNELEQERTKMLEEKTAKEENVKVCFYIQQTPANPELVRTIDFVPSSRIQCILLGQSGLRGIRTFFFGPFSIWIGQS